jgi:hypothetical protein
MFRRQDLLLLQIAQHNLLSTSESTLREGRRDLGVSSLLDSRFPEASQLAKHIHQQSFPHVVAALCVGRLLHEGPKFFEFSARDCEAPENFSLDLPVEEYGQPFPTLMIKLPPDYADARVSRIQHFGSVPWAIILHHDREHSVLLVCIRFNEGDVGCHLALDWPGKTVEDVWQEFRDTIQGVMPEQEPLRELVQLSQSLIRLSLSACLMMMVYGTTQVGPDKPGYRQRLERYVQVARRSGDADRLAHAEFDLQALPIRYRFAQDVRLYREEHAPGRAEGGEPTGRVVSPHWRRGHYRMQACGPGLTQRRRIAVPAVLVNSHLFVGTPAQTSATYRSTERS